MLSRQLCVRLFQLSHTTTVNRRSRSGRSRLFTKGISSTIVPLPPPALLPLLRAYTYTYAQQTFLTLDRVDIGDVTDKNIESVKVKTVFNITTHKNMGGVTVAIARSCCFEFQQPIVACPTVFNRA